MKEFEDALLDISRDDLDAVAKKHNDIDTKAIGIITISGILISILVGSIEKNSCLSTSLFFLTSIFFLITVFVCILVIRPRNAHEPSTLKLIEELKDEVKDIQISRILQTHAEIEDELQDICNKKAFELSIAVISLGISVILLILYTISSFF